MMSWIFLLQLIVSFEALFGAQHETLCTSNACFTLHMDEVSFEKARGNCTHNGGYLITVRNQEEEDVLRSLLSQVQRQHLDKALPFWIGLRLQKGDCVKADQRLKGFKWESGEQDSNFSNWEKEPQPTCTDPRCATIHYTVSGLNQLKWTDRSCKKTAFYACVFYFKGMCRPLALVGPGNISYTAPFSEEPLKGHMQQYPLGTYADISCREPSHNSLYTFCLELDNTYRWHEPGPFCKTGRRDCTTNNGGCEHLCQQDAEGVRCFCREGYDLAEDGLACRMKAACRDTTCEHQCVVTESGYSCRCREGFELDVNQRNCSDIDECKSRACRDHVCLNTHGSYTCKCQGGYQMVGGKCVDIDECTQRRCEHSCSNSMGSFSCHCNEGFSLSADGHSCVDIDECARGLCPNHCVNTAGSYSCSGVPGFHVVADGLTPASNANETSSVSSTARPDESPTRTTVELQHQSPHTDPSIVHLENATHGDPGSNTSSLGGFANSAHFRVVVCVLGSVIPLLLLVAVTLTVALFRCRPSKKESKKKNTADGYCWVPSGLDQRLEKLYESI